MGFEASVSRGRTGLLVAGSLAFVIVGLWLVGVFGAQRPRGAEVIAIGWIAIIFFGLCSIGWGAQLFQSGVVMRIDANGIYWRRWSKQTIPWSAIERFRSMKMNQQRFVCLFLRDPGAFPAAGILGRLSKVNKAMGYGDVALTANGTNRSADDLFAAVDQFAPAGART